MRPKSEIYTPKRDDEHPRLFHMGVPPPAFFIWESPPGEQTHTPGTSLIKKMRGPFSDKWHLPFCKYWYFFWNRKRERAWIVPFTKYRYIFRFLSTWRLALVIPTNGTENFGRFGDNGKKVIPRKVLLFFRKKSTRVNRSLWILPGISRFSIQMVSAQGFINTIDGPMSWICIWGTTDCTTVLHLSVEKLVSLPVLLNTGLFKIIFL